MAACIPEPRPRFCRTTPSVDVESNAYTLRSRAYWGTNVDVWRKKEAYIALGRFLHGESPGYRQWDCFNFADHVSRAQLGKTFVKRHLPLSDGNDEKNFEGKFSFDWKKHAWVRSKTSVKPEPTSSKPATSVTPIANLPTMIFDVELGRLVPLI